MTIDSLRKDVTKIVMQHEDKLSDGYKFYSTGDNVTNLVTDILEAVRKHNNVLKNKKEEV
jgi:hypothetical protein